MCNTIPFYRFYNVIDVCLLHDTPPFTLLWYPQSTDVGTIPAVLACPVARLLDVAMSSIRKTLAKPPLPSKHTWPENHPGNGSCWVIPCPSEGITKQGKQGHGIPNMAKTREQGHGSTSPNMHPTWGWI